MDVSRPIVPTAGWQHACGKGPARCSPDGEATVTPDEFRPAPRGQSLLAFATRRSRDIAWLDNPMQNQRLAELRDRRRRV
jgi:hypothetical protein